MPELNIAVGSDHAGYGLKQHLAELLKEWGHHVDDLGAYSTEAVDYPDVAKLVAESVCTGQADFGVLVCGSGNGMAMTANKVPGVRAALVHDETSARMARQHNDANVFCIGERFTGIEVATAALKTWLETPFEGGRHARRVAKLEKAEGQ